MSEWHSNRQKQQQLKLPVSRNDVPFIPHICHLHRVFVIKYNPAKDKDYGTHTNVPLLSRLVYMLGNKLGTLWMEHFSVDCVIPQKQSKSLCEQQN